MFLDMHRYYIRLYCTSTPSSNFYLHRSSSSLLLSIFDYIQHDDDIYHHEVSSLSHYRSLVPPFICVYHASVLHLSNSLSRRFIIAILLLFSIHRNQLLVAIDNNGKRVHVEHNDEGRNSQVKQSNSVRRSTTNDWWRWR